MPNVNPTTTTNENLQKKFDLAAQKSLVITHFILGASNHNIEEIKKVDTNLAAGLKVFMGASTGDMLVDNPDTLEDIYLNIAQLTLLPIAKILLEFLENEKLFTEKYGDDLNPTHHPYPR